MSNFAFLSTRGSLASWVTGSPVTGAEFWFFESSIVKCPNFADGGTYAPATAVIVGGAGIKMTGTFWCAGFTKIDGNATIGLASSNALTVESASRFKAAVTCDVAATVNGNLNSTTYTGLHGTVSIDGALTASGDINLTGAVKSPFKFGTGGYMKRRFIRPTLNPGSDKTVSVLDYDQVLMAVVADVVLTDDGEDGAIIYVVNQTTGSITVKNTSGSPIMILSSQGSRSGFMRRAAADLRWDVV